MSAAIAAGVLHAAFSGGRGHAVHRVLIDVTAVTFLQRCASAKLRSPPSPQPMSIACSNGVMSLKRPICALRLPPVSSSLWNLGEDELRRSVSFLHSFAKHNFVVGEVEPRLPDLGEWNGSGKGRRKNRERLGALAPVAQSPQLESFAGWRLAFDDEYQIISLEFVDGELQAGKDHQNFQAGFHRIWR